MLRLHFFNDLCYDRLQVITIIFHSWYSFHGALANTIIGYESNEVMAFSNGLRLVVSVGLRLANSAGLRLVVSGGL